jgi:hypothetical protein
MAIRNTPPTALPLSLLSAALLLTACGGGGDTQSNDTLTDGMATGYAANATVVGGDAANALDVSLQTTAELVASSAGVSGAAAGREQAQSTSTGTLNCVGGGTAALVISGASAPAELNGQLEAGEVYAVTFNNCQRAGGAPTLNGGLSMHVDATASNGATVTFTSTNLAVTLPRGTLTFNGSVTVQRSVTVNGNNTDVSTHVTASSFNVATNFNNGRIANFTFSSVDLARQASYLGNALQSSTYSGSHTLTAVLPNLSYSYTVATQGGFDANGTPNQGGWVITLPRRTITITISGSNAIIAVDDGKDGSIDRSFSVPIAALVTDAG